VNPPRYVVKLKLQVVIPFLKSWERCHELVRISASDYLWACIEKPLSVQRKPPWRTFPEWKIHFAEPGGLPGSWSNA
jgi:hypothetical protein